MSADRYTADDLAGWEQELVREIAAERRGYEKAVKALREEAAGQDEVDNFEHAAEARIAADYLERVKEAILVADRYTLPPSMGGHECEQVPGSATMAGFVVSYTVEGEIITSTVPRSWLTPVKPPLPPEPPDGSVVRAGEFIAERDDKMGGDVVVTGKIGTWFTTDDDDSVTWATLVERAAPDTPVLLVPDPFAEPVQLPWRHDVTPNSSTRVDLGFDWVEDVNRAVEGYAISVRHTPEGARAKARALWAAADQADKDGTK